MKKIVLINFLLIIGFSANAQQLIDRVIAKVGSENVLLSDVENRYAFLKKQSDEATKCEVLKEVIAQKLIVYQAKLDSVSVTDEEVNQSLDIRFNDIIAQMGGDEERYKEVYGKTVQESREEIREPLKQQMLAQRMQQNILSKVQITPKEVKDFFNDIPKDSIPYLGSEVELGELVMKPILTEEEKNVSKDLLRDILSKIKSGEESFEKMALTYSQDGSASRGGDLGFAKRGSYVPAFEAAVYNLDKGEVSDIVETEFGYHIIKLVERRGNIVRAKHILIKPEITQAAIDRTKTKLDSIKTLVEADSLSFGRAVKRFGYKKAQSFSNSGKLRNPATGNNFFKTDDLEADIYFEIVDLKANEISAPQEYSTPRGEKQFRLIQLQSMTTPHQANLEQDFDKITNFAKENKKIEYFNKWVEEKLKTSFIRVDDKFKCPDVEELIN